MQDSEPELRVGQELNLVRQILNNPYYRDVIKPELKVKESLNAIVDLDVDSVGAFFAREQMIGELRANLRLEALLEDRERELEDELRSMAAKDKP